MITKVSLKNSGELETFMFLVVKNLNQKSLVKIPAIRGQKIIIRNDHYLLDISLIGDNFIDFLEY
jgi:hypothetical protein